MIAAIRKADRRHTVYYEPNLQFDVGAKTGHGKVDDPNAGFSFHNYCLGAAPGLPHAPDPAEICKDQGERRVFQNAEAHVEKTGATLLMTEFGDVQDATIHTRMTELADEYMVGWTVWGWFRAAGQIKQDPAKPPTPRQPEHGGAGRGRAARTRGSWPERRRATRSTPRRSASRRASRRRCRTAAARAGGEARSTSRGCTTAATTASPSRERRSSRGLGTQRLELRARRGAKSVTVTVTDR